MTEKAYPTNRIILTLDMFINENCIHYYTTDFIKICLNFEYI